MKKREYQMILWFCLFLCPLFFVFPVQAASSIPKAVETAADQVVQVLCETGVGQEKGSGFVVSEQVWKEEDDGEEEKESEEKEERMYVVTTYNLVEANKKELTVKWKKQTVSAKAVGYFPTQNIAVLELEEQLEEIKILPIRETEQKNEIDIYPVGYQYDKDDIKEDCGKITSKKQMVVTEGREAISVYETNAQMSKKNIGGPTLDKKGYVVGVNFFNGNSGAVITEEELTYFLEEKNVEYKTFQMDSIVLWIGFILGIVLVIRFVFVVWRKKAGKKQKKACIMGVQGEYGGAQFPINPGETIWFGRDSSECQIVFPGNKKISRRHCSVFYDAEQQYFVLTDLNSSNGTWIGPEKVIPEQPAVLQHGEEFSVGDGDNVFRVERI